MADLLLVAAALAASVLTGVELAVAAIVGPSLDAVDGVHRVRARVRSAAALGRAMPFAYAATVALAVGSAALGWEGPARPLLLAAVAVDVVVMALTLTVLVPINARVARWDPLAPPVDWEASLRRWDAWHRLRVTLLAVAAVLLLLASAT